MKGPMNKRVSQRKPHKRHGPKPKTFLMQLRVRSDQHILVDLPGIARQWLGKRAGDRIWVSVDGQGVEGRHVGNQSVEGNGLRITGVPWGPYAGRRTSSRIRTTHVPLRQQKMLRVDPPPRFKRRSSSG